MEEEMAGFLIAIISGALMSVQGVFNTTATKSSSIWVAASFVQITAFLVCLVIWYFSDGKSFMTLTQVPDKWTLLGGVIGAFITVTVIKSMNSLGPAKAAMLIVISQLIIAYVIELLGWFGVEKQPLTMRKVAGMAIAIFGVVILEK